MGKEKTFDKASYDMEYARTKLHRIPLDVPLAKYDEIKAAADKSKKSVNGYIKDAIDHQMAADQDQESTPLITTSKRLNLDQLRALPFVYQINKCDSADWNDGIRYEINLEDGYTFGNDSGVEYAASVADLNELVRNVGKAK